MIPLYNKLIRVVQIVQFDATIYSIDESLFFLIMGYRNVVMSYEL